MNSMKKVICSKSPVKSLSDFFRRLKGQNKRQERETYIGR